MAWFRCYDCPDRRPGRRGEYRQFERDRPLCPGCGAGEPVVVLLNPVHFLMPDAAGPIFGSGRRWKVGCQPRREVLAVGAGDSFAVSHDVRAVTCPSCRGIPAFRLELKAIDEIMGVFRIEENESCCG